MEDLSSNEHLPLIDDVMVLVLVAGVTKTGQHLSAFHFPQHCSAGERIRPAFQSSGIPDILFS